MSVHVYNVVINIFLNYLESLVSLNYKSMKETRLTDEIITAEQMKVIPENYK